MSTQPHPLRVGEEPPPLRAEPATAARPAKRRKGKGTGDRFQVINAFADFTLASLDRAAMAVWLLLWRDTKKDGTARTSQADLGRRAGVSERTVRRAVRRLADQGLLTVVYRGSLRRGASAYRVHALARSQQDTGVR
jgi:Helix-turn-helix domain